MYNKVMANVFSKYLGKLALMAASVLWASDVDDAVKYVESEYPSLAALLNTSSTTVLYGCCETENEYLDEFSFEDKGVFVEVYKWTKHGKKGYRDFKIVERTVRGEIKKLFEAYKSFFEKEQLYMHTVSLSVSLGKKGAVKNVEIKSAETGYETFDKQIADRVKQLSFKGFTSSSFSLDLNFYIPIKELQLSNWAEWQQALIKGLVKAPKKSDIAVVYGFGLDVNYIWYVCRRRTPMLRHLYRKYLRKNPKFSGTVVLKIDVGFGGLIEKIEIDSSTTGYKEFDEDVRNFVSCWFFGEKQIQGSVKIPFTFYEGSHNE